MFTTDLTAQVWTHLQLNGNGLNIYDGYGILMTNSPTPVFNQSKLGNHSLYVIRSIAFKGPSNTPDYPYLFQCCKPNDLYSHFVELNNNSKTIDKWPCEYKGEPNGVAYVFLFQCNGPYCEFSSDSIIKLASNQTGFGGLPMLKFQGGQIDRRKCLYVCTVLIRMFHGRVHRNTASFAKHTTCIAEGAFLF
jgi:hypothetical protein